MSIISVNIGPTSIPFELVSAIIGIILIGVLCFFYLKSLKKKKRTVRDLTIPDRVPQHSRVVVVQKRAVPPKDIDLFEGRGDLMQRLKALVEKYSLEQFTIATADGFVFASSGGDNTENEAATFSERFLKRGQSDEAGVFLFGFIHKSSDLVGIVRTRNPLSDTWQKNIKKDTEDILNSWL